MIMEELNPGAIIKKLRANLHITQKELAERTGINNKTISAWENGTRTLKVSSMLQILDGCNVSLYDIFIDNENILNNFRLSICKACGNIIITGCDTVVRCCGMEIQSESMEKFGEMPDYEVQKQDEMLKIIIKHEQHPRHYIRFMAYLSKQSSNYMVLRCTKEPVLYVPSCEEGEILVYCTRDGLAHAHYACDEKDN